jgi:hypothetical protein
LQLIAREGNAAPSGAGVSYLDIFDPVVNNAGQVAFGASLTGANVGGTNDGGLFIGDGEETIQIVREGQSLAGSTIVVANLQAGQDPGGRSSLNSFSQLSFRAELADGRRGIFLFTPEVRWRRSFGGEWDAAENWTLSMPPANPHDVKIDPAGTLTVLGPRTSATVKSLSVGGGTGIATLYLQLGGSLAAAGGVTVEDTGVLTGDGTIAGDVTNRGRIVAENVTISGTLTNHGIVTGSGRIAAQLVNAIDGEVRVSGGQQLRFAGDDNHTNNGRIEVFAGELELDDALANGASGQVAARNAVLRFNGGLLNQGTIGLSFGTSDVTGIVQNLSGGKIIVSGGSDVTFYDNVVNNGELRTSAGSTAVYFGNVSGTGTFTGPGTNLFEGTFSPGASPGLVSVEGDVALSQGATMLLEIAGETAGESYDQVQIGGVLDAAGTLDIRLLDDYHPGLGAGFELLSFNELDGWFDSVNLPALGDGLLWQTVLTDGDFQLTVVPEPASLGLCVLGLAIGAVWFSKRSARRRCSFIQ